MNFIYSKVGIVECDAILEKHKTGNEYSDMKYMVIDNFSILMREYLLNEIILKGINSSMESKHEILGLSSAYFEKNDDQVFIIGNVIDAVCESHNISPIEIEDLIQNIIKDSMLGTYSISHSICDDELKLEISHVGLETKTIAPHKTLMISKVPYTRAIKNHANFIDRVFTGKVICEELYKNFQDLIIFEDKTLSFQEFCEICEGRLFLAYDILYFVCQYSYSFGKKKVFETIASISEYGLMAEISENLSGI